MKKTIWPVYWSLISTIFPILLSMHLYFYITQPDWNSFFVGAAFSRGAYFIIAASAVFFCTNIYTLVICIKNKNLTTWIGAFAGSCILVFLSAYASTILLAKWLPLNAWQDHAEKDAYTPPFRVFTISTRPDIVRVLTNT